MRLPKDLKASIEVTQRPEGPDVYHVTVTIKRKKHTYDVYGDTALDAFSVMAQAIEDGYGDYEDVPVTGAPEPVPTEATMPEEDA